MLVVFKHKETSLTTNVGIYAEVETLVSLIMSSLYSSSGVTFKEVPSGTNNREEGLLLVLGTG